MSAPVAIIDIGSNSVRMVVYHAASRVPLPVFNEKYSCQLGAHLADTGMLNPEGVIEAKAALQRFMTLAQRMNVTECQIIATAAVRDATDGEAFAGEVSALIEAPVTIISGREEAKLAAYGVLSSMHDPRGLVVDLGGGSMELAHINDSRRIDHQHTMEIGVLRLAEQAEQDLTKARDSINRELGELSWLRLSEGQKLYAIGGSFRALAKSHQLAHGYPLNLLHEYTLSEKTMRQWCQHLLSLSSDEYLSLPGISERRAELVPVIATAMECLLNHARPAQIVTCVSGIREGALYQGLSNADRQEDPLVASAAYHAAMVGRKGSYAEELYAWMAPVCAGEAKRHARLRKTGCILSEFAWTIDPNFRAEWMFWRVIQSSMKGLSHQERVILALMLYYRYARSWKLAEDLPLLSLIDEKARLWAKMCGLTMNLAAQLSAGRAGHLASSPLTYEAGEVSIAFSSDSASLNSAVVQKRVEGLGEALSAFSKYDI